MDIRVHQKYLLVLYPTDTSVSLAVLSSPSSNQTPRQRLDRDASDDFVLHGIVEIREEC